MSLSVQTNIADGYLASYERPIGVSMMTKLESWSSLQDLGFAAMLDKLQQTFHGLEDFQEQMDMYSSSNALLKAAWRLIEPIVPLNRNIKDDMYEDPTLGYVGDDYAGLTTFGQVFAVSPDELQDPDSVQNKVSALS